MPSQLLRIPLATARGALGLPLTRLSASNNVAVVAVFICKVTLLLARLLRLGYGSG
jgi:hypothetical protein